MIVTTNMLKEQYKSYSNKLDKIKRDVKEGKLFRINRGVYETDRNVNPCFLASSILGPSYLSFEWALSYYGLIPERVYSITSASFLQKKNKTFKNVFATYTYSDISPNVYSMGVTIISSGNYSAQIASKEKAICDCLSKWPVVANVKDLKELMFIDKRIYIEEFETCNFNEMILLASKYKKTNLDLLIKLVRREYLHE